MPGTTRIIILLPGTQLRPCANLVLKESVPGVKGIYDDECRAGVGSAEMGEHVCHVFEAARLTCTKASDKKS